jgi:hypothetical protein
MNALFIDVYLCNFASDLIFMFDVMIVRFCNKILWLFDSIDGWNGWFFVYLWWWFDILFFYWWRVCFVFLWIIDDLKFLFYFISYLIYSLIDLFYQSFFRNLLFFALDDNLFVVGNWPSVMDMVDFIFDSEDFG